MCVRILLINTNTIARRPHKITLVLSLNPLFCVFLHCIQAMHFCYGVGAFVSPMIAEPFLLNEDCTPLIDNMTGVAALPGEIVMPINATQPASTLQEAQEMTRVRFAFWIMCALQVRDIGL